MQRLSDIWPIQTVLEITDVIARALTALTESLRADEANDWSLRNFVEERPECKNDKYLPQLQNIIRDKRIEDLAKDGLLEAFPHSELISLFLICDNSPFLDEEKLKLLVEDRQYMQQNGIAFFNELVDKSKVGLHAKIIGYMANSDVFAITDVIDLLVRLYNPDKDTFGSNFEEMCGYVAERDDYRTEHGQGIVSRVCSPSETGGYWGPSRLSKVKKALKL